MFSKVLKLTLP